ncbi:hypothetical protein B296_00031137, partial [Ensete ventricosum]
CCSCCAGDMEVGGGRGRRGTSSRETSPPVRGRLSYYSQQQEQQRLMRARRKVQVIYYLSRNGQLEHPHFIELPHLPNHQLRLRGYLLPHPPRCSLSSHLTSCSRLLTDVMERLTLLRGNGMPSLFSWSCKRQPKPLPVSHKLHLELEEDEEEEDEQVEEEATEEEEARRGNRTEVGTGYTRCSRGVSTDEIERVEHRTTPTELTLDDSSPPSSTSSDKPPAHATGGASRRSEDTEPGQARNSVLLQLIACGSASLKGMSCPSSGTSKATASAPCGGSGSGRHRGVVSRLASRGIEEDELRCFSENPRLCHPLVEDKEYFSGSIVEGSRAPTEPSLKKSSSFNEERLIHGISPVINTCVHVCVLWCGDRSSRLGIGEGKLEVEESRGGGVKGKCIPGRRKSSGWQQ